MQTLTSAEATWDKAVSGTQPQHQMLYRNRRVYRLLFAFPDIRIFSRTLRYSLTPSGGNGSNSSWLSSGQPGKRFSSSVNNDAPGPFIFAVSGSPIIWAALSLATGVPAPALWPVRHGFLRGNPAILQEATP